MLITYFVLTYAVGVLSISCGKTGHPKRAACPPVKKCSGINEVYEKCKIVCPPQFCNISYTTYGVCEEDPPCEPGCNCKKDYLRDFDGVCVYNEDCPPPKTEQPDDGDCS